VRTSLLAVTIDGIIPESVKVWKISASATADDYHNNIGESQFERWMTDLENILERLGGSWLIIIVSEPRDSDLEPCYYYYTDILVV